MQIVDGKDYLSEVPEGEILVAIENEKVIWIYIGR